MVKNLISGPILTRLVQIWVHQFFFVNFTSSGSKALFQAIILCNLKEN